MKYTVRIYKHIIIIVYLLVYSQSVDFSCDVASFEGNRVAVLVVLFFYGEMYHLCFNFCISPRNI